MCQISRHGALAVDPRQLYLEFFKDLKRRIERGAPDGAKLADLLVQVGIRGLGLTSAHLNVGRPTRGGTRWRVDIDDSAIRDHLADHVLGANFLNPIQISEGIWGDKPPLIGASDVSQHVSAVPVPARFFKRSVPFVLNNAAGTLFVSRDGKPAYDNLFNPKPSEHLLRWMLIDPSYQDELEPEDYRRCLASAMDVGQYKFDLEYLLKADRRSPDVVFRDGSLFPQDAYIDNYLAENKRADFTREAIRELLACLTYAREVGAVYCGVSKQVRLKVYSAVVDWFIETQLDSKWSIGSYVLNDGQAMTLLLSSPSFVGDRLDSTVSTCLIRRSFTTRANLNTKAHLSSLDRYLQRYEQDRIDITPYRRLCEIAHVHMLFVGHSKSPQQLLPRYEFFAEGAVLDTARAAQEILAAIQACGLMMDRDHSFMADESVTYLIPSVTQQAHHLSKNVGKYIDRATGQWIMARYRAMIPQAGS